MDAEEGGLLLAGLRPGSGQEGGGYDPPHLASGAQETADGGDAGDAADPPADYTALAVRSFFGE